MRSRLNLNLDTPKAQMLLIAFALLILAIANNYLLVTVDV